MENTLVKPVMGFIGKQFHFKHCGLWYCGVFIGISADLSGSYGMVFTCVMASGKSVDPSIVMLVHPSQTKCIAKSPFHKLRAKVRQVFKKYGLTSAPKNIYVPIHCLSALCRPARAHEPKHNMQRS